MKKVARYSLNVFFWVVGSFLYCISINSFCVPNSLVLGGVSGVATVINHIFPILPIGFLTILINIPLFIAGFIKLGRKFIINTSVSTLISSVFIDIFADILPKYSSNKLLAALAAGVTNGLGLALIFANGSTTGGIDILAKFITKKFKHLSMGRVILIIDAFVILLSYAVYRSFESAVYSCVIIFISTKVIDSILFGISTGKTVMVITTKADEIYSEISKTLGRGATIIPVKGAYTHDERNLLLTSVRTNEISYIYSIIEKQDENAFITVADARDIIGEGFKKIDD